MNHVLALVISLDKFIFRGLLEDIWLDFPAVRADRGCGSILATRRLLLLLLLLLLLCGAKEIAAGCRWEADGTVIHFGGLSRYSRRCKRGAGLW